MNLTMPMPKYLSLIALLFFAVNLDAQAPPVAIDNLQVTRPIPGQTNAAGYLEMTNESDEAITLVSITASFAARVELHETMNHNGMMQMHELESLVLEPGETVALSPGGKHLMIMGVDGDTLATSIPKMQFHFANGLVLSETAAIKQW